MNNADWWANKLAQQTGQPQVGRPNNTVPMPPSQLPMQAMPTFQPAQPTSARQLPSSAQTASCPDCGSGNYLSPDPRTIASRCYDCGYPLQQSGSRFGGLAGAHVEGSAKPATGNDGTSNWNPQGIIGRIDG